MEELISSISGVLTDYVMVITLLGVALFFTIVTRGVQFRMIGEMCRLLVASGKKDEADVKGEKPLKGSVSSFQAFTLSIAARVGTGNLAGVATAITVGGPGAIFWMWVIALLGASSAFVESTLAQLYKVRGGDSFRGGPAYYIQKGIGSRWWAVLFAILITLTFGIAFNTVQSNTIACAFEESFGFSRQFMSIILAALTLIIIFGGIKSISRFSEIVVPVMAVAYIVLAIVIIFLNIGKFPEVISTIVSHALGYDQALGGVAGMGINMGIKRGLFSNEAGEGSTPNAAATATTSHPVKQGLIQTLGVYTDTLLICTATAFIILSSGIYTENYDGIVLTQKAIDSHLGAGHNLGSIFVSLAILFFAFTSIIANYYYGETNIRFIRDNKIFVGFFRLVVGLVVYLGGMLSLNLVWGFADITMALMTLCNLAAILVLGKYAVVLLKDYTKQRKDGKDPAYVSSTIPEIAAETECWTPEGVSDSSGSAEKKA